MAKKKKAPKRLPKRKGKKAVSEKKKRKRVLTPAVKGEPPKSSPPPEKTQRKKRDEDIDSDEGHETTLDKTPMRIYLNQIEKIPLLTPEEEIQLGKKVVSGTPEAHPARERMIRSNLRLVISIAKRYSNIGLPFSDLVEEGNIGLMRAVDKFNYRKGYRFSTYASWWIKQAIMRALSNQGKTIRVPVYMFDILSKWRKVRESLVQKLSRIPTAKEIADIMKLPVEKIQELERIATQPGS